MLEKKETVQKTFRLDSKVNYNFEKLSEILERTQNDLANVAIQNLLEENTEWLARDIFVDYASDFFNNGRNISFTIDNISVDIVIDESTNDILLTIDNKNIENKIDFIHKQYKDTIENIKKIKELLRKMFYSIDANCEEVKQYVKQINNYK